VTRVRPREDRRVHRGVSRLPSFPGVSPLAYPHHQLSGELQPGAKEAYAGSWDLSTVRRACVLCESWLFKKGVAKMRYLLGMEEPREHRLSKHRDADEVMLLEL
jgi:hypothetical protein